MSDESDDICCPPSHIDSVKSAINPKTQNPDDSSGTSGKGPVPNRNSNSKNENKPKKRTVAKSSGRVQSRPKRTQPPARRKTAGKGLLFEDDVSPVQQIVSSNNNVSSSSDEDIVGRCVLKSRKVSQKKPTRKESCDSLSETSKQQDDIPGDVHDLPTSESASFDVNAETSDHHTSHLLIDELFGDEAASPKLELQACSSRRDVTFVEDAMDKHLVSNVELARKKIRTCENSTICENSKDAESVIHCQVAGDTENSVDLDAELFGF